MDRLLTGVAGPFISFPCQASSDSSHKVSVRTARKGNPSPLVLKYYSDPNVIWVSSGGQRVEKLCLLTEVPAKPLVKRCAYRDEKNL